MSEERESKNEQNTKARSDRREDRTSGDSPSILNSMTNRGPSPQDNLINEKMKKLQKDMSEIKKELREILEILKVQEK